MPRPRAERLTRADEDTSPPLTPAEFAAAVAEVLAGESADAEELLRAAVRVPLAERGAALRALRPVLRGFVRSADVTRSASADDPSEVALALAWLARTHEPGDDLAAWSDWISAWVERERFQRARREWDGLDLPLDLPLDTARVGSDAERERARSDTEGGLDLP